MKKGEEMEFLDSHLSEILSFLAGLASGSFLTLKIKKQKVAQGTAVDQSKARAGGDIVGGNKSSINGPSANG